MTRRECEGLISKIGKGKRKVSVFCFTNPTAIPQATAGLQIEVRPDVWDCVLEVKAESQPKALQALLAAVKALEA